MATTDRGQTAVFLVLLLLVLGGCADVNAQPSEAKFSVGGNAVARAGEGTLLFCNREYKTADPPSSYVWVKDGKVIPGHAKKRLELSSVTRQDAGYVWVKNGKVIPGHAKKRLELSIVTRQDAGYYQCGTPDSSSYGQGVQLHVFVPGDVLPKPNLQPIGWAVEGRPFSLYCHFFQDYIPSPATSYTWYKDSVEVKDQKGDSLRFPNLTETDQGDYTCTAREGPAETTSPMSYEVYLSVLVPAQVRIKPPGPVVRGVRGENLTLTCEVTRAFPGVPDDGYSWSYLPSPKGPQRPLEGKTSTLTFSPLTLEDRGQYVCQARNDQMYRHLDFTLGGNASVTVDVVYLDNLTLISDLEVSEGDRVTLTCAVDSRPTAQLTWTVHGQEVRHVTDNVDHYVISRAACSDSGSYTCGASNTELPGRDRHATLQLYVHCNQVPVFDTNDSEFGAIFNFLLPDWTPMVVVHPGGHDVISVRQDCSYNVSPAFQSRCLQPWCDSKRHRLSFTLTNVTEEDEGEYVCLEERPQRRPIYNCSRSLHVKKCVLNTSEEGRDGGYEVALVMSVGLVALLVALLIGMLVRKKRHQLRQVLRRLSTNFTRGRGYTIVHMNLLSDGIDERNGRGHGSLKKVLIFDRLYDKGKVYIFPMLASPVKRNLPISILDSNEDELQTLLRNPDQGLSAKQKEFEICSLLRLTLQKSKRPEDLPSFILHNTRISRQENVILILDKNLGVVVMVVNTATSLEDLPSAEEAARHLVEVRDTVRRKLQRLVTSRSVQAVLSLPCLTQNEAEELNGYLQVLLSHPDVELLAGKDPKVFKEWVERWRTGSDRGVWKTSNTKERSSDSIYKMVVHSFLTLPPIGQPGESPDSPDPTKTLLLTPAQVEVRDSMARLLHVRGPPGSGKTMLLVHRARQWLAEGKVVILAVGRQFYDIQLSEINRLVRKGLGEEICSRIRVCHTVYEMQRAVIVLNGLHADVEVCLIVDILSEISLLKLLLPHIRSRSLFCVWTAGWKSLHSDLSDLSKQMHDLGWESLHLPDCIRCTDNTVELLNLLGHGVFPPIPSCSVPRDQDIPARRVVDHCLHPDHVNTLTRCVHCKQEMTAALPSMTQGPCLNNWIALHTGDPNKFDDSEAVQEAAKQFGVPISDDSDNFLRHEAVLSNLFSRQHRAGVPNFADFRKRVMNGVDKAGRSTLHLLRVEDFKGMEREGVILVHKDKRDMDPGCQSKGDRASRLEEHRHQWIQAASRSTGQVILLLLSPSPAHSLLRLPKAVMP